MAITIKHPFVSAKVDSLDASRVQPSNWNAAHTLFMSAASLVGRGAGAGQAAAVEIPMGATGQAVVAAATQAAAQSAIGMLTTQAEIAAAPAKAAPVDADTMPILDSAAGLAMKRVNWSSVKAYLLTYFNTQYQRLGTTFTATQNFVSSTVNVVLATTGAGAVFLRPNGLGSTAGQVLITAGGNVFMDGALSVDGSMTASGIVYSQNIPVVNETNVAAKYAAAAASANVVGSIGMFLRIGNTNQYTAGQTLAGANLAWSNVAGTTFGSPGGTWVCLGYVQSGATGTGATTLWMRTS